LRRIILSLATLLTLFCGSGAHCIYQYGPVWPTYVAQAPQLLPPGATKLQVMQVVNDNTARVTSLSTSNATISSPTMPVSLRGNIALERPNRFRLRASHPMTGPEVDLGSNDQLFWVWLHREQPPAVYFCHHDQLHSSAARERMPIEPKWLIEALGLTTFDPDGAHSGPRVRRDGSLEILSTLPLPSGHATAAQANETNKITIIDARHGWVLEQHVYRDGRLVASALARDHRYDPLSGVSLPQRVEIHISNAQYPNGQMTLDIDLGNVQINSLAGDRDKLWTMPSFSGSSPIDLGQWKPPVPRTSARPFATRPDAPATDRQWNGARRR